MAKELLQTANDYTNEIPRIPTGVFILDILTGGGVPLWKYTIFWGAKSSGKTTNALRVIGNFLELYPDKKVLYVDFEQSFDKEWASHYIDDENFDRLFIYTPIYGEEGVDMVVDMLNTDEDIGFVLIDSLAGMIPTKDATNSAEDDTMGLQAKLVNKLIRKTLPIIGNAYKEQRPLTYLLINQTRQKVGGQAFMSGQIKPAGVFQDFVATLDIRFYFKEYKHKGVVPTKGIYTFKVEKGKIKGALVHSKGEYAISLIKDEVYDVGESIDHPVVVNYSKKLGVLERVGNKWQYKDKVFKKLDEVLNETYNNPEFYYSLREEIMKTFSVEKLAGVGDD